MKLPINRSNPFNPQTFIRNEWSIWRGPIIGDGFTGELEQDARSLEIHEVDWKTVRFMNHLHQGETSILGEEQLVRLRSSGGIALDAHVGQALYEDYLAKGSGSVLEWLRIQRNILSFIIKGTTLRCPAGGRYSMYFSHDGVLWDWGGCWHGCRQGVDGVAPMVF